jgi:N-acetylmuramoyl-L-alanine amidase
VRRLISLSLLIVIAITSIVLAQTAHQATLRLPTGEQPVTYIEQAGQPYFPATEIIAALGGTITPDATGFKVTLNDVVAAFGPDSRYGVVREDLIEMPVPPINVEGRPYVPWQFFSGLMRSASDLDVMWDAGARLLVVQRRTQDAVAVQMSVTNLQGISKIVLTLSAPAEFAISKDASAYTIRFRVPLQAPFTEQAYEDPYVSKAAFEGNTIRIQLTAADIVGDSYQLNNPFRIVLDLRKGAAPAPGGPLPPSLKPVEPLGIRTIVIDPGHGGKEVGAVGPKGLMEKDVTLAVARKLAAALQSRIGARVILTREDDSVVSLDQRTAIANQYGADLFLSIHMNAAVVKGAKGSETYFLSLEASDELARRAAETENASAASVTTAGPVADLKLILWDLAQQEYLQESSRFAQMIQEEMNAATGVGNRGVKQAPFKVLIGATMPAALVEVGFISNPEEEQKLESDAFQNLMVETLTRAIQKYKNEYETRIGLNQPPRPAPTLQGGGLPSKGRI